MGSEPIRFTNGTGYDRFMAVWTRFCGDIVLNLIDGNRCQRWTSHRGDGRAGTLGLPRDVGWDNGINIRS
jgi:hypothetical protein